MMRWGADYQNTLNRFPNEAFIKKFVLKFLDDNSYANLKEAIAAGNVEEAFRAAHTLKGVCLNLGFDNLYKSEFSYYRDFSCRRTRRS